MNLYSQRDSKWSGIKLGSCTDTIGQSGCAITCLGMLANKLPNEVNTLLKNSGGYNNGCLVNWPVASTLLGLEWLGSSPAATHYPTIAETKDYAPSVPQHFFIALGDGYIYDPIDGKHKANPYKITGYRNVRGNMYEYLKNNTKWLVKPDGEDPTVYAVVPLTGEAWGAINRKGEEVYHYPAWQFINNENPAEVMRVLGEVNAEKDRLLNELNELKAKPPVMVADPSGEQAKKEVGIIKTFIQLISNWFKS